MAISALVGIGLALSAIGTVVQMQGQAKQTEALKSAENTRRTQMELETKRRNREAIRTGIVQTAIAEYAAFSQGAQGGSGLPGGVGQVQGDVARTQTANNQNNAAGSQIFAANQAYYDASGTTSFGVGLSSIGGTMMSNAGLFNRVGGGAFA